MKIHLNKNFALFLEYGINSILFQRGINSADPFVPKQQYGLTILMSKAVQR